MPIFGSKFYQLAYNSKSTGREKLKFGHYMGAYESLIKIELGGPRFCDQNFTGQKSEKL